MSGKRSSVTTAPHHVCRTVRSSESTAVKKRAAREAIPRDSHAACATLAEMITCRRYQGGVLKEEDFDPSLVSDMIQERGARVWLDLADPTEHELAMIQEEFGLHELAMEDTRMRGQRPKVEVYDGYFFVTMHALALGPDDELVDSEIHAFAGHR